MYCLIGCRSCSVHRRSRLQRQVYTGGLRQLRSVPEELRLRGLCPRMNRGNSVFRRFLSAERRPWIQEGRESGQRPISIKPLTVIRCVGTVSRTIVSRTTLQPREWPNVTLLRAFTSHAQVNENSKRNGTSKRGVSKERSATQFHLRASLGTASTQKIRTELPLDDSPGDESDDVNRR